VVAVLEEWIRNVPTALVKRIVSDPKVRGGRIWTLAVAELERRRALTIRAA
jgi:hypothetical protein